MTNHSTLLQERAPKKLKDDCRPHDIIRLAFAFWPAKVLLSAVELKVFDALAIQPLDGTSLARRTSIHPRGAQEFFDALVSLGLLAQSDGLYRNAPPADQYLNRSKPQTYIGALLEFANQRLYPVWNKLAEALRTGQPQNEAQHEADYYSNLMRDTVRLKTFLEGMTGLSLESAYQIAHQFEWRNFQSFADIGGAQGALAVQVAQAHSHLTGVSFDLPAVSSFFHEYVECFRLGNRLQFQAGDFFRDPLPGADVLIIGHVLSNWNIEEKRLLLRKAYEALPGSGALLVFDAMMDQDRKQNTFALLMSLNMLLVTSGGSGYTTAECRQWMEEASFHHVEVRQLGTVDSLVIGYK